MPQKIDELKLPDNVGEWLQHPNPKPRSPADQATDQLVASGQDSDDLSRIGRLAGSTH